MIRDFQYAVRQMVKHPGFSLIAILSLALGIGASTAVFSVVYAALIDPYPYPAADRIVRFSSKTKGPDVDWINLNGAQIGQIEQSPVVESVLAMDFHAMSITGRDYPENVIVTKLIASGFRDLGVPPFKGRGLLPSDAPIGQEAKPVTVLSYKFWQKHFSSDPNIVGKQLELDREKYLIVGVAAPRFTWYSPDIWLPLPLVKDPSRRYIIDLLLKPGVSKRQANAALQPIVEQLAKQSPKQFPKQLEVRVEGLNEWVARSIGGTLYLLLGAVLMLLAIGCGNVSILLMARGTARQHELSVRSAIGANRRQLMQQLLTESMSIAIAGALLGVLLSYALLAGIRLVLPRYAFAPEVVVRINLPVLFFGIGVALLTGLIFGLWPAFRLSKTNRGAGMQLNVRRVAGSVLNRRTHETLVAGQIALTLLLMSGAGAAMQGFLKLLRAPLGYDAHRVMTVPVPLRENTFTTWASRGTYFEQLRKTISEVPGVTLTAISGNATPPHSGWSSRFELLGKPAREELRASLNLVSAEYFPTLRIPLLRGRFWTAAENRECAHVAIVNRAFARRYFEGGDAIGHSVKFPGIEDRPPSVLAAADISNSWLTIVGMVGDARDEGLRDAVKPAVYVPFTFDMWQFTQVLVRAATPPLSLEKAIRRRIAKFNPDQQVFAVEELESIISEGAEWQQEHLAASIFAVFAILGLALAAVGLYSVVSYVVAQRTGELGIRMALGAQARHVLRTVFATTLASVLAGAGAGLLLSLAFSGFLESWAGGSSRDPLMLFVAIVLLSLVAGLACLIPARHALKIDPMSALRFE